MAKSKKSATPSGSSTRRGPTQVRITEDLCRRVLKVVDKGLSNGLDDALDKHRNPLPGHMCVEAAVCYSLGEPHGDNPSCVDPTLRNFKIAINDCNCWTNNKSRARGLRRLAIAQLGTRASFDAQGFLRQVGDLVARELAKPAILQELKDRAKQEGWSDAQAKAAEEIVAELDVRGMEAMPKVSLVFPGNDWVTVNDLDLVDDEKQMRRFCEGVVQILIKMKTPGSRFLGLTEGA